MAKHRTNYDALCRYLTSSFDPSFLHLSLELVHKLKHKRIWKMSLHSSLFIKHPRKGFKCTLIVFIFPYVYVQ